MSKCLPALLVVLASYVPSMAQVATAELTGSVLDSSGAAIAGAKITATDLATNVAHGTINDASGVYVLTLLPPGDYSVAVEAAGFRKLVQTGIALQINQEAKVDLTLEVGQVSETLQVTGQAPLLQSLGTVPFEKISVAGRRSSGRVPLIIVPVAEKPTPFTPGGIQDSN